MQQDCIERRLNEHTRIIIVREKYWELLIKSRDRKCGENQLNWALL